MLNNPEVLKAVIDKKVAVEGLITPSKDTTPQVSVFELNEGDKILDLTHNRIGIVSRILETKPEWIEAFIVYDHKEEILNTYNKIKLKC